MKELANLKRQQYESARDARKSTDGLSFKFHKSNMAELLTQVYPGSTHCSLYERPMINGMIQDSYEQDMVFMWDQIGKSFV